MALRVAPLLDLFAPLSHKEAIGPTGRTGTNFAPTWVPASELRRLNAYMIRAAYASNVARFMARTELEQITTDNNGLRTNRIVPADNLDDRREYGDAALLIDRVQAGVLGDTFEIVVDGADADLPDEPELPDEPTLPEKATEVQRRVFEIRQRMWADTVDSILNTWENAWHEQPELVDRQQWLRDWADDELLPAKIVEAEQDICGLADGVYVLSLSNLKRRPLVDVYDPGFYFPVLTDTTRGYPDKVHLAWEYETTANGETTKWVRRLTWELSYIRPVMADDGTVTGFLDPVTGPDGRVIIADRVATAAEIRELQLWNGAVVREYPWNVDSDGKPVASGTTCFFTDARWKFEDLEARTVLDLTDDKAEFAITDDLQFVRQLDLRIDFLPVIHIPNTPASRDHFGQSVIDMVLQILDDIQVGDTDINDAAGLAAGPALGLSGSKSSGDVEMRPKAIFNLGESGRMDVLDMSQGLGTLAKIQDGRLDRLCVNGRVPAEVLGRGRSDGSAASSGFHELLKFGPFIQLIGKLRMSREPKYALMMKLVQRFGMLGGQLPGGATLPARIAFGSFLPSDRAQLVSQVTGLLNAKAISTQTAVALLVAGGLSIDDARGEVQRIRAENGATAVQIATAIALGDSPGDQAAADWLGIEIPAVPSAPSVPPPGPPVPDLPPPPAP